MSSYKLVTETWFDGVRQALKTVQTVVSTAPQDVLPAGATVKKYSESIILDYGNAMFLQSINGNEITFTAIVRPGINIRFGFRNFACNTSNDIFATCDNSKRYSESFIYCFRNFWNRCNPLSKCIAYNRNKRFSD